MSADLLITALLIDESREPDFKAADLAVATLAARDILEPARFADHDPDTPTGLSQIRSTLRADLRSLQAALEGSIEITEMTVRSMRVYLTGGLSWGGRADRGLGRDHSPSSCARGSRRRGL